MTNAALIKQIKEDPTFAEQLLYPGKQLADFDETKLKIDVISSGFPSLDHYKLLKRDRGELIIIGARPSQGKSGLGFQIATNVAEHGKAHIFSLEMDHESIVARQCAIRLNRPLDYIQGGRADGEELRRVKGLLGRLNCIIDDRAGLNVHQICDAARMQNKKSRTSLIVVDYLQIIEYDRKGNRVLELGAITMALKNLAKELRVPVIALSQLNRQSEFRDGGKPQLSDLQASGSLEQDADMVLLIHKPEAASPNEVNMINIITAKNRNGPTGETTMEFVPAQCRFIDQNILD